MTEIAGATCPTCTAALPAGGMPCPRCASQPFQGMPYQPAPHPSAPFPGLPPYPGMPPYQGMPYPGTPYQGSLQPAASFPGSPYPPMLHQAASYPARPPKSAGIAILLTLLWIGAGHLYLDRVGTGLALMGAHFFLGFLLFFIFAPLGFVAWLAAVVCACVWCSNLTGQINAGTVPPRQTW